MTREEGMLSSAKQVIENGLSAVNRLAEGGWDEKEEQDAIDWLINEWKPFADGWIADLESGVSSSIRSLRSSQ